MHSEFGSLLVFKGELQYFIGVQLDGSDHVEPLRNRLSETTEQQSAKLVIFFFSLCKYVDSCSSNFHVWDILHVGVVTISMPILCCVIF